LPIIFACLAKKTLQVSLSENIGVQLLDRVVPLVIAHNNKTT